MVIAVSKYIETLKTFRWQVEHTIARITRLGASYRLSTLEETKSAVIGQLDDARQFLQTDHYHKNQNILSAFRMRNAVLHAHWSISDIKQNKQEKWKKLQMQTTLS